MSDILGIAGNAVTAYQLALGTVSNNIANVSTDGYSRQSVELSAGAPRAIGTAFIGSGVVFDRVRRQYDAFAEANLRNSNSDMQAQVPVVDYANRVIDVLGGQTSGLTSALDQFYASARALSADPASTVLRGAFVRDAQGVTARFSQLSGQLDLVDVETRDAVDSSLGQLNTLTTQLAAVNRQLSKQTTLERQPAELLDQRDRVLRDLSQFARLNTRFGVNGSVQVSLGASIDKDVIVNGQTAVRIGADYNAAAPEKVGLVLDSYGNASSLVGVTSGKLAGLLTFREQVLGSTRNALDFVAQTLVKEVNSIHREGVDAYGDKGGDLFAIDPAARSSAGGLSVVVTDPLRIAAAAQFRVSKDPDNTSVVDALISYQPIQPTGPSALNQVLVNNGSPAADKRFSAGGAGMFTPVATVPAGFKDVVIYLDQASDDQQLSLVTRDGRQILGPSLSSDQQAKLMGQAGFTAGATYSDAYLGKSGPDGYKDISVFYGARAGVVKQQTFVMDPKAGVQGEVKAGPTVDAPAVLSGGRISASLASLAPGLLSLNGVMLSTASPTPRNGSSLQADEVATWLNQPQVASLGITATASNDVRVPLGQLKLDKTLVINTHVINQPVGGFASGQALADAINAASSDSGVQARVSQGELVLTNVQGQYGRNINIESLPAGSPNALGIASGVYTGRIELTRSLQTGQDTPIEISFAGNGRPSDLAKLGFRTGAYVLGGAPDDLMAFVGSASSTANTAWVAASYAGQASEPTTVLRANPMRLDFVTGGSGRAVRYRITDIKTDTVLAERELDPKQFEDGINYQGLKVSLSSMPVVGDSFVLDGNKDGTGNNENMLRLLRLQSKALVGSKSIGEAYIDHVNDMGNIARQSTIALDALQVVHDQAVESRDKVSGVSLDEEAANLIRFQQAYQASAKVMQVATALFDAVLQVR